MNTLFDVVKILKATICDCRLHVRSKILHKVYGCTVLSTYIRSFSKKYT